MRYEGVRADATTHAAAHAPSAFRVCAWAQCTQARTASRNYRYFGLDDLDYPDMSPVLIPRNYTKRFIDGEITAETQAILRLTLGLSLTLNLTLTQATSTLSLGLRLSLTLSLALTLTPTLALTLSLTLTLTLTLTPILTLALTQATAIRESYARVAAASDAVLFEGALLPYVSKAATLCLGGCNPISP